MSLFYPFWQQSQSSEGPVAKHDEYPTAGRVVLPQVDDALLIEFRPELPRPASLIYKGRLRAIGLRRLVADGFRSMATEGPAIEEIAKAAVPAQISFVQSDVLYRFETAVVSTTQLAGETTTVSFARPRTVTRIQRRHFYRVPVESTTSFYSLEGDSAGELVAGRILNLSVGGLLLSTNREVDSGAKVVLRVPVGRDGFPTDIKAEALECVPSPGKMSGYHVRFRFDNGSDLALTEEEQEGINQYLYEQQRMMLRVRKLIRGKA